MTTSTTETPTPTCQETNLIDGIEFRKEHQGLFKIHVKTPVKNKEMLHYFLLKNRFKT